MTAHLQAFLRGYRDSRSREYILTTRLVHDLTVAAASSGYTLLVYLPTVDADGFDIIFDDKDRLVPTQLKSIVARGKAATWEVRRSLLRPRPEEAELYGFESSPAGTGRGGGVILTTAEADGEKLKVSYKYTDITVLSVLWEQIVKVPQPHQKRLLRLRKELESQPPGRVKLPRSAFMHAATPSKLLAMMGLHSHIQSNWRLHMMNLLKHKNLGLELPAPRDVLSSAIAQDLRNLAV